MRRGPAPAATGNPPPAPAIHPGSFHRPHPPARRAKAAWEAYYEEQLPLMKEKKPGLRLMQYKSMIFENWQRSPLNPRNQVPPRK